MEATGLAYTQEEGIPQRCGCQGAGLPWSPLGMQPPTGCMLQSSQRAVVSHSLYAGCHNEIPQTEAYTAGIYFPQTWSSESQCPGTSNVGVGPRRLLLASPRLRAHMTGLGMRGWEAGRYERTHSLATRLLTRTPMLTN